MCFKKPCIHENAIIFQALCSDLEPAPPHHVHGKRSCSVVTGASSCHADCVTQCCQCIDTYY